MSFRDAVMTLLPPYLVFGPVAGIALTVVFVLRLAPGRRRREAAAGAAIP